jgi:CRISPR/Cas system-associated exonuclease Cas4 (RecB family)
LSKAYLINSSSNLVEFISHLILNEGLDHTTVIFPNRRPAIYLSKAIASKKNKSVGFIELFSIDDFVNTIYEKFSNVVYPQISTLEAVFLIFEINQKVSFININNIDYFWPWGYKIYSDFEELYLEQVNVASIDYLIQNNLPDGLEGFSNRISRFSTIYSAFYETLEANGFCTRSVKYKKASLYAENFAQESAKNIIFAGFYDLTKTEQVLFKNLLRSANGIFVSKYGPKIKDLLTKININQVIEDKTPQKKPNYHFIKAPYLHNEIFKLKELKNEFNGFRDRDLIVLSSESYLLPIIHNVIDPKLDTFNISIGYPLSRTPIVSFLDALLNLHKKSGESIYISDYLSVILHPYVKSLRLGDIDFVVKIYANCMKSNFLEQGISFVKVRDLENEDLILDTINKLKQLGFDVSNHDLLEFVKLINFYIVDNFLSIKNIGDFLDKVVLLVDFLQNNSNVSLHAIESKYIEGVLESLNELSTLSIKSYKLGSTISYFNLLKNFIKTKNIAFPSSPTQGFQVIGSLETRNLTFSRVFYLGVNEGIIPNIPKQDTILTDDIRKILGLSTSKDRLDMQKYNFFNLVNSADEVFFFYETAQDKTKSRFLEEIFWETQKQEKNLKVPEEIDALLDVTFTQSPPPKIENSQKVKQILNSDIFHFSASSIDTYLNCKAKFYFSYILRLKETTFEEDLDARSIGTLSHNILHSYFSDFEGKLFAPKNLDSELKKIYMLVDSKISFPSKSVWLQKEQVKYAISRFLKRNFKDINQRIVQFLEFSLNMDIEVNGRAYRITGKLDKIDNKDGTTIVVDYKTGIPKAPDINFVPTADNKNQWLSKIKSFQLPVYALLVRNNLNATDIEFEFWGLKDSTIKRFKINSELLEAYTEALKIIIDDIVSCDYFEYTNENIKNQCANCPYKIICSRHFVTKNW